VFDVLCLYVCVAFECLLGHMNMAQICQKTKNEYSMFWVCVMLCCYSLSGFR